MCTSVSTQPIQPAANGSRSNESDAALRKALSRRPPPFTSDTKFALHRASILAALGESTPQRDQVVQDLIDFASAHGGDRSNERMHDTFGRLVFRIIAIALAVVAISTVVFAFVLSNSGKTVEAAFYTLGASAIGGLSGVLAPRPVGTSPATTNAEQKQQPD
jgi:predicted phage tail protein